MQVTDLPLVKRFITCAHYDGQLRLPPSDLSVHLVGIYRLSPIKPKGFMYKFVLLNVHLIFDAGRLQAGVNWLLGGRGHTVPNFTSVLMT